MERSKYDTNPLDHSVKRAADEAMGVSGEDESESLTRPMPVDSPVPASMPGTIPEGSPSWNYSSVSAPALPQVSPVPPSHAVASPDHVVPFTPNGVWHGEPVLPARGTAHASRRKGLDIDANVEAGLSYFPALGAIMALLVLVKEPKENQFARFNALQALIIHGALFTSRILLSILAEKSRSVGASWLWIVFSILSSMVDLGALAGLIYLGIRAFKLCYLKVPVAGALAEKYLESL